MTYGKMKSGIQFMKCPFCDTVVPDLDGLKFMELVNHAPNWEGTSAYFFCVSYIKNFKKATKQQMKKWDKIWIEKDLIETT